MHVSIYHSSVHGSVTPVQCPIHDSHLDRHWYQYWYRCIPTCFPPLQSLLQGLQHLPCSQFCFHQLHPEWLHTLSLFAFILLFLRCRGNAITQDSARFALWSPFQKQDPRAFAPVLGKGASENLWITPVLFEEHCAQHRMQIVPMQNSDCGTWLFSDPFSKTKLNNRQDQKKGKRVSELAVHPNPSRQKDKAWLEQIHQTPKRWGSKQKHKARWIGVSPHRWSTLPSSENISEAPTTLVLPWCRKYDPSHPGINQVIGGKTLINLLQGWAILRKHTGGGGVCSCLKMFSVRLCTESWCTNEAKCQFYPFAFHIMKEESEEFVHSWPGNRDTSSLLVALMF